MELESRLKKLYTDPTKLYLAALFLLGLLSFSLNIQFDIPTNSEWVLLYSLVGSIVLLNHVNYQLPPNGNSLSMDSALYLACIFTFGLETALTVLLISAAIIASYRRRAWWKHVANFANYSIMIVGAYYVFIYSGGLEGGFDSHEIYSYLLALTVYFAINVISIGVFYLISMHSSLFKVLQGIIKDTLAAYISTILLSLMLTIMFETNYYFSLALFLTISILLSISFMHLFKLYNEVSDKATRDQRTGLYNHGYFEERLEKEIISVKDSNTPFSLAILDVDNFKVYNDTFGHMKGDKLLEFFGKLLFKECENHGYIVARYGGEEFTILMPGKQDKEAFSFINSVRKKVNDSHFEGVDVFPHGCLSFSAGIIEYNKEIYDKSHLLDKADQAMYYAKAQGKNLVNIFNEQSLIRKSIDIDKDIFEIEQQLKIFLSKDVYTFQHSKRVFSYAMDICNHIPLADSDKKTLILGALFHDIGKLEVPKHILKKKEKLTPEEWETVKRHVTFGKEIVSAIDKYKELIPLVELHHERVDGKGYPYGLKGEEIPKLARILCIIDSFDAMTTERPYQKTKTFDEAIQELRRCAGHQFDAEFVEPFIQMISQKYDFKLVKAEEASEVI